ncbi:hypothetical protein TNCV_433231 [Trichonephila clavipes]|nr:hypothetical protein TNCV_433231 [Trichonephila clavipes]
MTDLETLWARVTTESPVYRERSEHDVQYMILHYLVGRWYLAGLEERAQPLDVRYQKCTDLRSNYHRSELEMCVLCTLRQTKPTYQMQASNANIELKQVTSSLLGDLSIRYGHQNIARRTGTRL